MSAPDEHIPDPLDVMIGLRVRVRRKALTMSQTELGNRIGVTFQQVQKYERGVSRIAGSTLIRVAQGLDTTVAALLGETDSPEQRDAWLPLAGPGALEMVRAYNAMPDPDVRAAFLKFAQRVAGPAEEEMA